MSMSLIRLTSIVCCVLALQACGGGDGSSSSGFVSSDTAPPVITLAGSAAVSLAQGTAYSDAGATALDGTDGIVAVASSGAVDTSKAGVYVITYTAKDTAGNVAATTRTVTVGASPIAPTSLIATPGDKSATLSWAAVPNAVGYSVCSATTRIPEIKNCTAYTGGAWQDTDTSSINITGLTNGTTYYIGVIAKDAAGRESTASSTVSATPMAVSAKASKVNDTGITVCSPGQAGAAFAPCPMDGLPKQDAELGRDATNNADADGAAGFKFTRVTANGQTCVKDEITGLTWEDKTDDGSLHDKDWTYTWYEANTALNGGFFAGVQNAGTCASTSGCDTAAFVQKVNSTGWCGYANWRLPTHEELRSIVSYSTGIDRSYFPNTMTDYWSSSPSAYYGNSAWTIRFSSATSVRDQQSSKSTPVYVRLVRGD